MAQLDPLARAWDAHNRQAFLEGYLEVAGIQELLPGPELSAAVMFAYELDKALYELDYERAHRPEWVPATAAPSTSLVRRRPMKPVIDPCRADP